MRYLKLLGLLISLLLASTQVLAVYSFKESSNDYYEYTRDGGGTWGSIFKFTAEINEDEIEFTVSKSDGGYFQSGGYLYIKVQEPIYSSCQSVAVNRHQTSTRSTKSFTFRHYLSKKTYHAEPYPKSFCVYYSSSNGQGRAWSKPITVYHRAFDAPDDFDVRSYSTGNPYFTWDRVYGADTYRVVITKDYSLSDSGFRDNSSDGSNAYCSDSNRCWTKTTSSTSMSTNFDLEPGGYYARVRAGMKPRSSSYVGTGGEWARYIRFTVEEQDDKAPYLYLRFDDGSTTTLSSVELKGDASDSNRGNNGISKVLVNGSRANNDTASGSGSTFWKKEVNLNIGENRFTIKAYDGKGNIATETVTVIRKELDTQPPYLYLRFDDGSTTTLSSVELKGDASDSNRGNNGISRVLVNGSRANNDTASGSSSTFWKKQVSLNIGENRFTIQAYDGRGNVETQTVTVIRKELDTQPPNISITSHSNNQRLKSSNITLSGTATDAGNGNNGVSRLDVNGSNLGSISGSNTLHWSKPITLQNGQNTISIYVVDSSNNRNGTSKVITLYYDAPKPEISVVPTNNLLNFGNMTQGVTKTQTVTIRNTGNADLIIQSIISNNNSFTVDNNCVKTITDGGNSANGGKGTSSSSGGAECTFNVSFTANTIGSISGRLTIKSNAVNSPNAFVDLRGSGIAPPAKLSVPSSNLSFAEVQLGSHATKTFTIKNEGGQPLQISGLQSKGAYTLQHNCPTSLQANQQCSVNVTFKPTQSTSYNETINITSNGGNKTVSLTGTGYKAGNLTLSTSSLDFGNVENGKTKSLSFNVSNTGDKAVSFGLGTLPNGFSVSNQTCGSQVQANASCAVNVTFAPTSAKTYQGTLAIQSNASNATNLSVALSGQGKDAAKPAMSVTPTSALFELEIGKNAATQTFTVENTGNADLTSVQLQLQDNNSVFSIADNQCQNAVIKPSESCKVTVAFDSTTVKNGYMAILSINSNADQTPELTLTGNVTGQAKLILSPRSHDFGRVQVGKDTPPVQQFTVSNQGSKAASIEDVKFKNDAETTFKLQDNQCNGKEVGASEQCTFDVAFDPQTGGYTQSEVIVISDIGQLMSILLSGEGVVMAGKMIRFVVANPEKLQNIKPGEEFDVTLRFEPIDAKPADGVQVFMEFNPEKLQVLDVKNSGVLDFQLFSEKDNNKGFVNFGAMLWRNAPPTGEFDVFNIKFKATENIVDGDETLLTFNNPNNQYSSKGEFITISPEDIPINFAVPTPEMTVDSLSLDFGQVDLGAGISKRGITISNTGDEDSQLTFEDFAFSSTEQSIQLESNECKGKSLNKNDTCNIAFSFNAEKVGNYQVEYVITPSNLGKTKVVLLGKVIEPITKLTEFKGQVSWKYHVDNAPTDWSLTTKTPSKDWEIPLAVTISDSSGASITGTSPIMTTTDHTGMFTVTLPTPIVIGDNYSVEVKAANTLRQCNTIEIIEGVHKLDNPLIVGDVVHSSYPMFGDHTNIVSSFVDVFGILQVLSSQNTIRIGEAGYSHIADINADGMVNVEDTNNNGVYTDVDDKGDAAFLMRLLNVDKSAEEIKLNGVIPSACTVESKSSRLVNRRTRTEANATEYSSFVTTPVPQVNVGDSFSITIQISTNLGINGLATFLDFDPRVLQVNSLEDHKILNLLTQSEYTNKYGVINFSGYSWRKAPLQGTVDLVTINFTVLAEGGEKTLHFTTDNPYRESMVVTNDFKDVTPVYDNEVVFANPDNGIVSGYVRDRKGNPIYDAQITVNGITVGADESGAYQVAGLPQGTYDIVVTKDDYSFPPQQITITEQDNYIQLDVIGDSGMLVQLGYFTATPDTLNNMILFDWATLSESKTAGFEIWRARPVNLTCETLNFTDAMLLTEQPIPANAPDGIYAYEYPEYLPNHCYGLEEIGLDGQSTFYIIGNGIDDWIEFSNTQ